MALLKKIHSRNIWWRYNNRPYVEPTEEQKRLQAEQGEIRRLRARQSEIALAGMLGTIEALCPGAMERAQDLMKIAKMF